MTHTAHPFGYRLGITKDWRSNWHSGDKNDYRRLVQEDFKIRNFLESKLIGKMVSELQFERERTGLSVTIKTARPGLLIGKEGAGIDELVKSVKAFARKNKISEDVNIKVEEIKYFENDANLIADSIVESLLKRMSHRRVMKQTAEKVMINRNINGIRIVIAGRLGGAEMARKEEVKKGTIPLQTIRANIDYAHKEAIMPFGKLGVKVWIYKKEE